MLREPMEAESDKPTAIGAGESWTLERRRWGSGRGYYKTRMDVASTFVLHSVCLQIPELATALKCMLQISRSFSAVCNGTLWEVNWHSAATWA